MAVTGNVNKELILSQAEAIAFLKYTLRIDDIENKIKTPKIELLQEIVRKFQEQIPFQNLSIIASTSTKERKLPSDEEIKTDCFSGVGGLSYTFASFGQKLLKILGYDTYLVSVNIPFTEKPYTHVAFIVKDNCFPGQRFLVDLGAGFPTLEPVPLHFLPLYYKHAFLEYKFVREDGLIARYHKVGDYYQPGKVVPTIGDNGWQKFYEFEEVERDDNFIKKCQSPIYKAYDSSLNKVYTGLRMTIYPTANHAYTINDIEFIKWKKGKEREMMVIENVKDLQDIIKKYFPTLTDINLQSVALAWEIDSRGKGYENRQLFLK